MTFHALAYLMHRSQNQISSSLKVIDLTIGSCFILSFSHTIGELYCILSRNLQDSLAYREVRYFIMIARIF